MDELARIKSLIYEIRGVKVMLDKDLADLYHVTTGNLNKAVKRNIRRFPPDFMFQLNQAEFEQLKNDLIFQNGISSWGGTRKLPYAFTEEGVAMLSGVLHSEIAIDVNISIMRAFVALRKLPALIRKTDLLETKREIMDYIDEILSDQNDINESTRAQLDAISTALAELQASRCQNGILNKRRPIGFIQPEDEENSNEG
jgi:hypothetical protein